MHNFLLMPAWASFFFCSHRKFHSETFPVAFGKSSRINYELSELFSWIFRSQRIIDMNFHNSNILSNKWARIYFIHRWILWRSDANFQLQNTLFKWTVKHFWSGQKLFYFSTPTSCTLKVLPSVTEHGIFGFILYSALRLAAVQRSQWNM